MYPLMDCWRKRCCYDCETSAWRSI